MLKKNLLRIIKKYSSNDVVSILQLWYGASGSGIILHDKKYGL